MSPPSLVALGTWNYWVVKRKRETDVRNGKEERRNQTHLPQFPKGKVTGFPRPCLHWHTIFVETLNQLFRLKSKPLLKTSTDWQTLLYLIHSKCERDMKDTKCEGGQKGSGGSSRDTELTSLFQAWQFADCQRTQSLIWPAASESIPVSVTFFICKMGIRTSNSPPITSASAWGNQCAGELRRQETGICRHCWQRYHRRATWWSLLFFPI